MGEGAYGKAFQMRALNVKSMGTCACGEGEGGLRMNFFLRAHYMGDA